MSMITITGSRELNASISSTSPLSANPCASRSAACAVIRSTRSCVFFSMIGMSGSMRRPENSGATMFRRFVCSSPSNCIIVVPNTSAIERSRFLLE